MENAKLFLSLILILIGQVAFSQQLYRCNDSKSFWVIEKDNSFFTVRIPGKVKETEEKNVLAVDSFALQFMIADKKHFIQDDSTGMTPLINYAINESEYFSGKYNYKVNTNFQKAPFTTHDILIWFFELPAHASQGVKHQVFASMISGDKIFGLAAPQFPEQDLEEVKDFLTDVIISLKRDDKKPDAEKLCNVIE